MRKKKILHLSYEEKEKKKQEKKKRKEQKKNMIQFFSEETGLLYQLYPTGTIPTLKISGVPMHRHVKITPDIDTGLKIDSARPFGNVLDTCTGLGYTAIYSAKLEKVKKVTTIEKDENVIKIARMNEASKELFNNSKIQIINTDLNEKIKEFKVETFDTIIHDPPTFSMAVELYQLAFYKELLRVLKKGGRLWHYAPNPGKLKDKKPLHAKIERRLKEAGFKNVLYDEKSNGVIAIKPR
ncbi:methyltransferase [Candidatus Pacearchaeota archaeon]|nr:methyltransferase [Candidatus Pacearchaeota archaeon]